MDVVKLELNAICRVCLQSGEMEAIFGAGGEDTAISLKIGQCSSIEVRRPVFLYLYAFNTSSYIRVCD